MELQPITPQPNDRDPNNFVGRVAITERARNHLKNGTNLLLSDPRRMGKTFWLRTFAAQEKAFDATLSITREWTQQKVFFSRQSSN